MADKEFLLNLTMGLLFIYLVLKEYSGDDELKMRSWRFAVLLVAMSANLARIFC